MSSFDPNRIDRLREHVRRHAASDGVGGVAWIASTGDHVESDVAGVLTRGEPNPVVADSLFRISSMSKPVVAVASMVLVEECRLRLDDPVDSLLPELADRRVLVDPHGPIDGATVPAERPITVDDVLTFRLGLGMDFSAPWPQPLLEAMADLGLGAGPPAPQDKPSPDEYLARLGTLPLLYQPGERWLYHVGADVLGVLVSRAAGQTLDAFLADRVFGPLGMTDTAFHVADSSRLGSCYVVDPATGARTVFDPPGGQWSSPPAFASGGDGLVSTTTDFHAFARMLARNGRLPDGSALLSPASIAAMTTDRLEPSPGAAGPTADGSQGWGLGVGVQRRRVGLGPGAGSYGWAGGLGSLWSNDPAHDLVGVILTTDMFTGPDGLPEVIRDFWTQLYAALVD